MKLKSGLVFVIAAVAFGAQARDMNSIQQSGELKVGVPGDYAPLAFHNKAGELVGYDVDMAKDLGKRLGLKVSFVTTSWPTLSADLKADKFDIAMGGVTETAARAKDFALRWCRTARLRWLTARRRRRSVAWKKSTSQT